MIWIAASVAASTAVVHPAMAQPAVLSADAIKAQSQALAAQIVAQIRLLPVNSTSSEDYETAVVQIIAQNSSNQSVQVNALTQALSTKGLPASSYSALRRILAAAKAGRLTGTAALDGAGFQPSSSFSAPIVEMGGGSVNYSKP